MNPLRNLCCNTGEALYSLGILGIRWRPWAVWPLTPQHRTPNKLDQPLLRLDIRHLDNQQQNIQQPMTDVQHKRKYSATSSEINLRTISIPLLKGRLKTLRLYKLLEERFPVKWEFSVKESHDPTFSPDVVDGRPKIGKARRRLNSV